MIYLILSIFYLSVQSYITYDSGTYKGLDLYTQSSFVCKNGYSTTKTISFSGTFEVAPQVFIVLELFDMQESNTDFRLQISTITTTNFNIIASCTTSRQVFHIDFNWYAIDDKRIEVFNSFNMDTITSKQFIHENPNAEIAIISVTSIYYGSGAIDFKLFVSEFTTTSITVDINQDSNKAVNLKQLGYQLILTTNDAVSDLGLRTLTSSYTSPALNKLTNKWLMLPIVGFNYLNTLMIVQKKTYTTTASTITYSFSKWGSNPLQFAGVTIREIWIAYIFTTEYKALQCSFVRISQKYDLEQLTKPKVYLEIPSVNQVYSTVGDFSLIVDKSISPVQIVLHLKCQKDKKVVGQFNKCNNCSGSQKQYVFSRNCNSNINQISFYLRFTPYVQSYQKLKISILDTSCSITQVLYNQIKSEENILNVQILNV
ncbi:unnamed protein product [Paramecium primaurelia]|uniref:H-type lectin domain-containing protein n=1 Tax=Paramecium primaurelia TaxID=5886 RepID=A0A8S1NBZ8_PARPR|nr:unnamed protein product [Paramecium primaurelia]